MEASHANYTGDIKSTFSFMFTRHELNCSTYMFTLNAHITDIQFISMGRIQQAT